MDTVLTPYNMDIIIQYEQKTISNAIFMKLHIYYGPHTQWTDDPT